MATAKADNLATVCPLIDAIVDACKNGVAPTKKLEVALKARNAVARMKFTEENIDVWCNNRGPSLLSHSHAFLFVPCTCVSMHLYMSYSLVYPCTCVGSLSPLCVCMCNCSYCIFDTSRIEDSGSPGEVQGMCEGYGDLPQGDLVWCYNHTTTSAAPDFGKIESTLGTSSHW